MVINHILFFSCHVVNCLFQMSKKCSLFILIFLQEIIRIKNEHPDDPRCIVNDRVKGRLKVTRAFGAGSLKRVYLKIDYLLMLCSFFY